LSTISYQENKLRIPDTYERVQANCCKNPKCENFGREPLLYQKDEKSQVAISRDKSYVISGLGKGYGGIKCKACGEITPIKSNISIQEEKQRLGAYLQTPNLYCPTLSCVNHNTNVFEFPKSYYRSGRTSGNQRYQCKICKKTFSDGNKRRKQKRSEINRSLYSLLMNKMPVKRCCEVLSISPQTYYRKVDWLHEQALGFVKERERKLLKSTNIERLYLSTDRQVHTSNWTQRKDKRNTELLAIGTADNRSGYVFGWHFNFDSNVNPLRVEAETRQLSDYDKPNHFRKHARLWLEQDFKKAQGDAFNNVPSAQGSLEGDVAAKYYTESHRPNNEALEQIDKTVKPPADGMLVHSEYNMYGHFHLLNDLFANTEKVRFYLDQESGIKNAFMSAFKERVISHTADAFYVKANKNFTVDIKRQLIHEAKIRFFESTGSKYDSLSHQERELGLVSMVMTEMENLKRYRESKESWLTYPFASKSEPEKMVAVLTDIGNLSLEHQARLYMKGTLHGIDRFFMQARRRVNIFERPFNSGTNARRTWYGYSPYDPSMYIKQAELFRLFYNYINVGRDKKTPAMRLGLAKGPVSYEKIIYFD
jgi:transposase-like protein